MSIINRLAFVCFLFFTTGFSTVLAQGAMVTSVSANSNTMVSRSPDSRGWTDPALNHNKLLQQQSSDGGFKLIGPYKVMGNPFLFGEHHKGNMYTPDAKALNIYVSYNTYTQEVEFYSTSNPDKSLVREPGTVDSFTIQKNAELGIAKDLKFIYGSHIGTNDKSFYQLVCEGERFNLYKKYKSDLGYSSTNIAQSELRQFDLQYDYYYTDKEGKGVKKIKPNATSVIKEFKNVKDLSGEIKNDDFTTNPEEAFCKAITSLNQLQKGF